MEPPSTSPTEDQSMKDILCMILAICTLLLSWTAIAEDDDPFLIAMSSAAEASRAGTDDLESIGQAAEQGKAEAQNKLGCFYLFGSGVPVDRKEAIKWYRKAAEQGHANAQVNLAFCYEKGLGVEKDENQARKWFLKAAAQGNEQSREKILLMKNETVDLCVHHPYIIIPCDFCKKVIAPIFCVYDYKGKGFYICSNCLTLPHCQYCRIPAVAFEGNDRLCRYCLRDVIGKQLEVEAVLQEVRATAAKKNSRCPRTMRSTADSAHEANLTLSGRTISAIPRRCSETGCEEQTSGNSRLRLPPAKTISAGHRTCFETGCTGTDRAFDFFRTT